MCNHLLKARVNEEVLSSAGLSSDNQVQPLATFTNEKGSDDFGPWLHVTRRPGRAMNRRVQPTDQVKKTQPTLPTGSRFAVFQTDENNSENISVVEEELTAPKATGDGFKATY